MLSVLSVLSVLPVRERSGEEPLLLDGCGGCGGGGRVRVHAQTELDGVFVGDWL